MKTNLSMVKEKVIIEAIEADRKLNLKERMKQSGKTHIDFWWKVLTENERTKALKG